MSEIKVAGVASFRLQGKPVTVAGDMILNLGTPIREPLESVTGPVGYKQKAGLPRIEFESILSSSHTVKELAEVHDVPITVTTYDGASYAYSNAWASWDGDYNASEAKMSLVFYALSAEEVAPQGSA